MGGVNSDTPRTPEVPLDFLTPGREYEATIYADAPDADAYTNPEAYAIRTERVTSESVLNMPMARGGGFAVSLKAVK